ncbi:MAG: ABC transporter substrate-binding protein [Oscillospiraceae bacterium]
MNKNKVVFMLFTLSLFTLVACGNFQAKEEKPQATDGMSFDNYGSEVKINQIPKKVITMGPPASELFCALGIDDKIIGNTLDNHSRGALPEYRTAYEKIPELNYGSATREAVLSSEADFIYGISWEFGSEGLDKEEMAKYGITVYENAAKSFEEQYKEISDIGKIFGVEEVAEAFIENQKIRIEKITLAVDTMVKKRVLVYDSGEKGIFTSSGSNFESLLIEKAGGENIFSDITEKEWITVSSEEVLARNPEIIIVHDYDSPSVEFKIEQIRKDPVLSQTDAVKNDKIFAISLENALPGPRMADTVETFYREFQ